METGHRHSKAFRRKVCVNTRRHGLQYLYDEMSFRKAFDLKVERKLSVRVPGLAEIGIRRKLAQFKEHRSPECTAQLIEGQSI